MIRRLIILLLIVGCAPTTANIYIGMTKKEFLIKTPTIVSTHPLIIDTQRVVENEGGLNEYIFAFENDTLAGVYHNIWNAAIQREIDYIKYSTPLE